MNEIDIITKMKVLELHLQGLTDREIAKKLGISHPTVGKIIREIESGNAPYLPKDIISNLKGMAEIEKIRLKLGIGYEDIESIFILGHQLRETGLNTTDFLKIASISKNKDEFSRIVEIAELLMDQESKTGKSIEELNEYFNSLTHKIKSIEEYIEEKLKKQGQIENELKHLENERNELQEEVRIARFLKEKMGGSYEKAMMIAEISSSWKLDYEELEKILDVLRNIAKNNIDPDILDERSEVIDFLIKYGITHKNMNEMMNKFKEYPSMEALIENAIAFAMNKERMISDAIKDAENYRNSSIASLENELKGKRESINELESKISTLKEQEEALKRSVSWLEKQVDYLSLERLQSIQKLIFLEDLFEGNKSATSDILVYYITDLLKDTDVPMSIPNRENVSYIQESPEGTKDKETKDEKKMNNSIIRSGPFIGRLFNKPIIK